MLYVCLQNGTSVGCNTGPHVGALLGARTGHSAALHLPLGVDDDTCVILEVDKGAFAAAPRLALAHHDSGVHL